MIDRQKWRFVKANVVPAFKRLLLDRPSPMFVEFFVTRKCNLRCSYCFTWKKKSKEPSLSELKARIDKLKELGCNVVSFMGGEPMLRKDIFELLGYCKSKKMFVNMDTNGTLLDRKKVDKLAELGMNSMVVSLDGIGGLPDSKKTLMNSPELLELLEYAYRKRGIRVFINLVLTKNNLEHVIPLIERIMHTGIIFAISLITKDPGCRMALGKNFTYTGEELKRFDRLFDEMVELKKKGYPMFEPLWYYENLRNFVRGKCGWECKAGRHFFSVDTDGRFLLCSDSEPIKANIMDVGRNYWKRYKKEFSKQINKCNKTCPENYAVCAWWYNGNKGQFIIKNLRYI